MYGGYTYGGTNFGGTSSAGNFYIKVLTDTVIATTNIFTRATIKVLVDTPILLSTILKSISRSFSDVYLVVSTLFNKAIKSLSDAFNISELFTKNGLFYRILSDSVITTSTIQVIGLFRRTFTDTINVMSTLLKLPTKLLSDSYRVFDIIRRYLNGLIINPWVKIVKTVASFTKIVKPTATYTKTSKPSVTDIWTKTDKPY